MHGIDYIKSYLMTQSLAHIIYILINHNLTGMIVHTENCLGKSVYTNTGYKHT